MYTGTIYKSFCYYKNKHTGQYYVKTWVLKDFRCLDRSYGIIIPHVISFLNPLDYGKANIGDERAPSLLQELDLLPIGKM